jgi:hypothetical protein
MYKYQNMNYTCFPVFFPAPAPAHSLSFFSYLHSETFAVQTLTSYVRKIYFNIILSSLPFPPLFFYVYRF